MPTIHEDLDFIVRNAGKSSKTRELRAAARRVREALEDEVPGALDVPTGGRREEAVEMAADCDIAE